MHTPAIMSQPTRNPGNNSDPAPSETSNRIIAGNNREPPVLTVSVPSRTVQTPNSAASSPQDSRSSSVSASSTPEVEPVKQIGIRTPSRRAILTPNPLASLRDAETGEVNSISVASKGVSTDTRELEQSSRSAAVPYICPKTGIIRSSPRTPGILTSLFTQVREDGFVERQSQTPRLQSYSQPDFRHICAAAQFAATRSYADLDSASASAKTYKPSQNSSSIQKEGLQENRHGEERSKGSHGSSDDFPELQRSPSPDSFSKKIQTDPCQGGRKYTGLPNERVNISSETPPKTARPSIYHIAADILKKQVKKASEARSNRFLSQPSNKAEDSSAKTDQWATIASQLEAQPVKRTRKEKELLLKVLLNQVERVRTEMSEDDSEEDGEIKSDKTYSPTSGLNDFPREASATSVEISSSQSKSPDSERALTVTSAAPTDEEATKTSIPSKATSSKQSKAPIRDTSRPQLCISSESAHTSSTEQSVVKENPTSETPDNPKDVDPQEDEKEAPLDSAEETEDDSQDEEFVISGDSSSSDTSSESSTELESEDIEELSSSQPGPKRTRKIKPKVGSRVCQAEEFPRLVSFIHQDMNARQVMKTRGLPQVPRNEPLRDATGKRTFKVKKGRLPGWAKRPTKTMFEHEAALTRALDRKSVV